MSARERIICLLVRLLNHPYRFTRQDLAAHFGVHKDSISDDIDLLRAAGLQFEQEGPPLYRCAVIPNRAFAELKHLLPLTEDERSRIGNLLQRYLPGREALYLSNKLESLYDFQRLGLRALRQPKLEIIDRLEQARKNQVQVVLEAYRSTNSNQTRDRQVEPFDINPELDTLQAYDLDHNEIRHFLLSRMERVRLTETPWAFQAHHRKYQTDVFRIVAPEPVMIHLELDVYAYNDLIERYPQAKAYIEAGAESNTFDFQCQVNNHFFGLLGFILGNAGHVRIISPKTLRDKVRAEATKLIQDLSDSGPL
ncbi:MAG: WYL domain-containing transcriptional regulator [Lewinellaceae bacterium]|nr:WYL domain-containing transcriptional regulator [Lewinellaceae bacterium]